MDDDIIEQMREASKKKPALDPITVRIDAELHDEIRKFCGKNRIQKSVLLRQALEAGFRLLRKGYRG